MLVPIIRNVEGVLLMAREDLRLLPAAFSTSRTAYEVAIRVLWLMDPTDPYEREVRWLAYLSQDEHCQCDKSVAVLNLWRVLTATGFHIDDLSRVGYDVVPMATLGNFGYSCKTLHAFSPSLP
jgi:hypothetical protein